MAGRAIKRYSRREDIVLATEVYGKMHDGPGGPGLSRKAVGAIDASLNRLDTNYVDLYQIHRWDSDTPVAETMEALHDIVKAGKVRYLGASSCTPGSSPSCSTPPTRAAGPGSCPCRTSTTCCAARTSPS